MVMTASLFLANPVIRPVQGKTNRTAVANPRILPPRRLAAALLSLGLVAGWHVSAAAQQVVARINGDPITAIDIAQRSKLIQVSAHKTPTRQEVIDELIDEKLKLQTAKRYKLEITDTEVDDAFKNIAN